MIHIINTAFTPALAALPWLERWGGAAFPVQAQGSYEDPETGQISRFSQTFPVSCYIGGDCEAEGYYSKLLPDDSYKSVAWLEAVQGFSYTQDTAGMVKVRQRARLIAWLNMQRLGALDCGGYEAYQVSVLQALPSGKQFEAAVPGFSKPAKVSVKMATGVEHTPAAVFGPYTFAIQQRLFLHPYAFFAVDFEVEILLPIGCFCLGDIEQVECITQW